MAVFNPPHEIDDVKKVFISGKITGELDTYKEKFKAVRKALEDRGHTVLDPSILPAGLEHGEYMQICYSMIDVSDAVVFLPDWKYSEGAKMEMGHCLLNDVQCFKWDEVKSL